MPDKAVPEIYTVCCRQYDGDDGGQVLFSARKSFFSGEKTVKGSVRLVENGHEVHIRFRIGGNCFRWRKTCGKTVLQEAFALPGGKFRLMTHDLTGRLVSAAAYDKDQHWAQTAYYDGDPAKPCAVLLRKAGGLSLLEYDPASGGYGETALLPCPMGPGSAAQSYINGKAGEPRICAQTQAGVFCYCPAEERELRLSLLKRLEKDSNALTPEWPDERREEPLDFRVIVNDGTAPARPAPQGETRALPLPEIRVPAGDYAADHEIFSAEPAPAQPAPAAKYAVAVKGLSGSAVRADAFRKKEQADPASPQEEADRADAARLIPAKRIVVSSMESYLYFGRLVEGLRQGEGRTQMQNGHTAYEGGYRGDKRDGFGVYYYKSGKICYVGGWKRNLRDGMGVAFGSGDGSIFVGNWKDGIPTGRGSAFDMNGSLIYTGDWKNGKRHGHGTEYDAGRVVCTGEWRDDRFCSGYSRVDGTPGEGAE